MIEIIITARRGGKEIQRATFELDSGAASTLRDALHIRDGLLIGVYASLGCRVTRCDSCGAPTPIDIDPDDSL